MFKISASGLFKIDASNFKLSNRVENIVIKGGKMLVAFYPLPTIFSKELFPGENLDCLVEG